MFQFDYVIKLVFIRNLIVNDTKKYWYTVLNSFICGCNATISNRKLRRLSFVENDKAFKVII